MSFSSPTAATTPDSTTTSATPTRISESPSDGSTVQPTNPVPQLAPTHPDTYHPIFPDRDGNPVSGMWTFV